MVGGNRAWWVAAVLVMGWLLAACGGETAVTPQNPAESDLEGEMEMLVLPEVAPMALDGRKLSVVASTSIIGDVVANVGGEAINLTVLMGPGQDPHSYQPGANDLTKVAEADIVFINGWNLEEGLVDDLATIAENAVIVPVNAGVMPLEAGAHFHEDEAHAGEESADEEHADEEDEHGPADPHTWFDIAIVQQWVANVAQVLETADPAIAELVNANAAAYRAELDQLQAYAQEQLTAVAPDQRVLVTNHDSLAYFARAFDFEVLGTVIPGASTLAEPSANDLTELIAAMAAEGVCTIFTETTVSDQLAGTVAAELNNCANVTVVPLYTGAVGPTGSGAESYLTMYRSNVDAIVSGLSQ